MQIMAGTQDVWSRLPQALKDAIVKELELGNTINGVSLAWPKLGHTLITMSKPFMAMHIGYDNYSEDTNPHYRDWLGRCYEFDECFLLASPY